jgi:hypothetical protein
MVCGYRAETSIIGDNRRSSAARFTNDEMRPAISISFEGPRLTVNTQRKPVYLGEPRA